MVRFFFPPSPHTAIYLDSSFLMSKSIYQLFDILYSHRITEEVYREIRRGKRFDQNSIIDNLLTDSPLINRKYFLTQGFGEIYDELLALSSTFHPYLQQDIERILSLEITSKEKIRKCLDVVDQVSRRGAIWISDYNMIRESFQNKEIDQRYFYREIKKQRPLFVDSWHKYHRDRLKSELKGTYRWTDERIVAAAVTESIFLGKRAIIITNDIDFSTIFFQLYNNLTQLHCQNQIIKHGVDVDNFSAFFTQECNRVNEDRKRILEERMPNGSKEVIDDFKKHGYVGLLIKSAARGDVVVHYYSKNTADFFHFPPWLIKSALENYVCRIS